MVEIMQRQMPDDSLMPQVVILAGGLGTRLGEMTEKIPKSLIEVSGKPIISHILDWVKQQGCDKVLILTGHLGEMFEHFEYEGLSIDFLQEPEQMGTGGALSNAIRLLFSFLSSSLILSNINTLASTAIPTVSIIPAIPGKVNVASNIVNIPIIINKFSKPQIVHPT